MTPRAMRRARRSVALCRGAAPVRSVADAVRAGSHDVRHGVAARLVRLEGAVYSVPCRWAGLDLVVRIGATTVTIVGREGTRILHPRMRVGQRSIDYRHYLSELARKPQAVRQVLPDLLRNLGEPFPAIWDQLHGRTGRERPRDSSPRFLVSSRHTAPPLSSLR